MENRDTIDLREQMTEEQKMEYRLDMLDDADASVQTSRLPAVCALCGPICECKRKLCTLCHEPIELGSFHDSCATCEYCHNVVGIQVLDRLIHDEDRDNPGWKKLNVYHQPCRDRQLREDFDKKPVSITQGHLDMINRMLACNGYGFVGDMLVPLWNDQVTVDTNQQKAEIAVQALLIDMTTEQKFRFAEIMKAVAMMASVCLQRDPKGRSIAIEITKKEAERFKTLEKERQGKVDNEVKKARKSAKDQGYADMMKNERQDTSGILRARRKAIEAIMSVTGLDEESATKIHDAQAQKHKGLAT